MKQMSTFFCMLLFVFIVQTDVFASTVDTLRVNSDYLNREVEILLIRPNSEGISPNPTLFLLHGYGGSHKQWIDIKPNLPQLADQLNITFICPNAYNTWYWDSPKIVDSFYESFFINELIPYLERHSQLSFTRSQTAITGLSMGGHGALWLAHRHPDLFGAVGSMSGGVDLRLFADRWNLQRHLGELTSDGSWDAYTVMPQVDKFKELDLAIIIDCGVADFFYKVNVELHEKLVEKQIPHDFITRAGAHNRDYWRNAIDYQLLFFWKYFKRD